MNAQHIVARLVEDDFDFDADMIDAAQKGFLQAFPEELQPLLKDAPPEFMEAVGDPEAFTEFQPNPKNYPVWPQWDTRTKKFIAYRYYPYLFLSGNHKDGATLSVHVVGDRMKPGGLYHFSPDTSHASKEMRHAVWGTKEHESLRNFFSWGAYHQTMAEYFERCAELGEDPLYLGKWSWTQSASDAAWKEHAVAQQRAHEMAMKEPGSIMP
jgi:hypothetical protein